MIGSDPAASAPIASRPEHSYRERMVLLMAVFRGEAHTFKDADLPQFLFHYFCCEVAAKLLQGAKDDLPSAKALRRSVHVASLGSAMRHYVLSAPDGLIDEIFKVTRNTAEGMSCRELRNHVLDEMSSFYIDVTKQRAPHLVRQMRVFIDIVEKWCSLLPHPY